MSGRMSEAKKDHARLFAVVYTPITYIYIRIYATWITIREFLHQPFEMWDHDNNVAVACGPFTIPHENYPRNQHDPKSYPTSIPKKMLVRSNK
jgi:hypothetical protein